MFFLCISFVFYKQNIIIFYLLKTDTLNFTVHYFVKMEKFQKAVGQGLDNYVYFNEIVVLLDSDETILT